MHMLNFLCRVGEHENAVRCHPIRKQMDIRLGDNLPENIKPCVKITD